MYSKCFENKSAMWLSGIVISALQVTERLMLFICMYVLFQSLLISDTFHLILKLKTHRLF